MENRILLFIVLIFIGCDEKRKNQILCNLENTPQGNYIVLENFNDIEIHTIDFQDVLNGKNKYFYNNYDLEKNGRLLKIDKNTISLVQKGCVVIINNSIKYKISEIKIDWVRRPTMWGKKMFCELKGYKLNDSIINDKGCIIIYK